MKVFIDEFVEDVEITPDTRAKGILQAIMNKNPKDFPLLVLSRRNAHEVLENTTLLATLQVPDVRYFISKHLRSLILSLEFVRCEEARKRRRTVSAASPLSVTESDLQRGI